MSRKISYWLVLNARAYLFNGRHEYYCMGGTTENPKLAMRYHTYEGAQQQAHAMGWEWSAHEIVVHGDESVV